MQWNCDRIIFLSGRGRNNWTHRPPSDSSISWPPADYMISENTRKFFNPFVSFLRPTPLCGGLCDAGQIGRVAYCRGRRTVTKTGSWVRKQGSWLSGAGALAAPGGCENKDAPPAAAGQNTNNLLKSAPRMSNT